MIFKWRYPGDILKLIDQSRLSQGARGKTKTFAPSVKVTYVIQNCETLKLSKTD